MPSHRHVTVHPHHRRPGVGRLGRRRRIIDTQRHACNAISAWGHAHHSLPRTIARTGILCGGRAHPDADGREQHCNQDMTRVLPVRRRHTHDGAFGRSHELTSIFIGVDLRGNSKKGECNQTSRRLPMTGVSADNSTKGAGSNGDYLSPKAPPSVIPPKARENGTE